MIQTSAILEDSAPDATGGVMDKVIDYFHSECRLRIPLGDRTDWGMPIRPPEGSRVFACLTKQECVLLQSRIRKYRLDEVEADSICESYGISDTGSRRAVLQCLELLARQRSFIDSDGDRILIVVAPTTI